jgi:hypothetical protein
MSNAKLVHLLAGNPLRQWPFDSCLFPTDRQWHFNGDGLAPGSLQLLMDGLYTYAGACELEVTKRAASGRGKGTVLPPLARG